MSIQVDTTNWIKEIHFKIKVQEATVNSKGEKDPGIIVVPGADQRF